MKYKFQLTDSISDFLSNSILEEISIGCSGSQVLKIAKNNNIYFLKIARLGLLTSEYNKLMWLENKLDVPKVVLYDKNMRQSF